MNLLFRFVAIGTPAATSIIASLTTGDNFCIAEQKNKESFDQHTLTSVSRSRHHLCLIAQIAGKLTGQLGS